MSNTKSNWLPAQLPVKYDEDYRIRAHNINNLWNVTAVDPQDVDAIAERIGEFFEYCDQANIRPTVTGLAGALGIRRETLWKWEHGGGKKGELISKAKGIMEIHLEEWLHTSRTNSTAAMFALKNHFGWKDSVEITTPQKNPAEDLPSTEEIIKKLPGKAKDENTKIYGNFEELLDDTEESGHGEDGNI